MTIPEPTANEFYAELPNVYHLLYVYEQTVTREFTMLLIRRCHHAEREAERLRARVAELEGRRNGNSLSPEMAKQFREQFFGAKGVAGE